MDPKRFDTLARSLHDMRSRRATLATLLSGALTAIGVTSLAAANAQAKGDGTVKNQGSGGQRNSRKCLPLGRICLRKTKKGSASENRDCKHCCASATILTGKKGRCCNHEGRSCGTTEQCCLGVCTNGTCQGGEIQVTPCAQYGETCTQAADCCNGVPCTNENCHYP